MSPKRIAIAVTFAIALVTSVLFLWPHNKPVGRTESAPIPARPVVTSEIVKTEDPAPLAPLETARSAPLPKRASKATRRSAPSASTVPRGPMVVLR